MKRFELGMSIDYCSTWGVVEAIREIFQNALDAQTANPDNEMYFKYDQDKETLFIGNKKGILGTNTLLLGTTSKAGNNNFIGKFGEGYKVATVVLLRLGKKVTVYNGNANEIWTAHTINSRRYNAKVAVFDIENTQSVADKVKELLNLGISGNSSKKKTYNLVFSVSGITADEYKEIVCSNLYLQEFTELDNLIYGDEKALKTWHVKSTYDGDKVCRILTDESQSGRLYVGGLYVTTSKRAKFGYDFSPNMVTLDRDRGFIDNMDLQWLCSKALLMSNNSKLIEDAKDSWDGEYIRVFASHRMDEKNVCEAIQPSCDKECNAFYEEYGDDAVAVTDTNEFNSLKKKGVNAVMTTERQYFYVTNSSSYKAPEEEYDEEEDAAKQLFDWYERLGIYLEKQGLTEGVTGNPGIYEEGEEIIEMVMDLLKNNK